GQLDEKRRARGSLDGSGDLEGGGEREQERERDLLRRDDGDRLYQGKPKDACCSQHGAPLATRGELLGDRAEERRGQHPDRDGERHSTRAVLVVRVQRERDRERPRAQGGECPARLELRD